MKLSTVKVVVLLVGIGLVATSVYWYGLINKYQDPAVVKNIMDNSIWQGQTSDQLVDAMGDPDDLDQKVLRTKKQEAWKYAPFGRNQYKLKIELENDVVVAWEKTEWTKT